jgi:serine/threonine-protein kinase
MTAPLRKDRSVQLQAFISELKRRRVVRALLIWGVASFAVLQVFEPVMHGLHLPEWTLSFVVVVLGLGFPVTAALAWIFDLKATGIERTESVEPVASIAPSPGPGRVRLALLLLGLGAVAATPGVVYFFVWPGAGRQSAAPSAGPSLAPSIAVLPFVNLSSDKEQDYFSDGVAEEILNALAQVDGLRVIGRTSSFAMRGKNEDLRTIGQKLNATNLLEGSVRKAGTRVRITAQLIEAAGGSHLWSQEFDGELSDIFAVQEKIAHAVVEALKLKLLPPESQARRVAVPEAHDQYLLGLAYMSRGSAAAYGRAVKVLRRSVALDPGFAAAWALLSQAVFWEADQGNTAWAAPVVEREALAAAEKAISLAPQLADGYHARGALRWVTLQDWTAAGVDLERALSLNPGSAAILLEHAAYLASLGRLPEALAELQRAADLDPLSAEAQVALGNVHLGTGQYGLAEAAGSRALGISPEFGRAARTLGVALLLQGRFVEARAAFHRSSNRLFVVLGDTLVEHSLGQAAASQRGLEAMLAIPDVRQGGCYQLAQAHAWRGELDRAFEWLDRAVAQHDGGITIVKYDPLLRHLRADPRFAALLRRLKLPVD